MVADVFDRDLVLSLVAAARPEVVVNLLTDLAGRDFDATSRIRREGSRNLVDAAVAAEARRLVVESISFSSPPDGAAAVAEMEGMAESSGLEAVILRFGYFWGPDTWHEKPEAGGPFIHVRDAAVQVRDAVLQPR